MAEEIRNDFLTILDDRWSKHSERYSSLYKKGYLKSNYRYNDMLECLKEYFHIRVERNQINHAKTEETASVDEVHAMILKPLDHWPVLIAGRSK